MPSEHDLKDFLETLNEDSPDLTDEEIERATPAASVHDVANLLGTCPTCKAPSVKIQYAVRRRKPNLYWRVTVVCENGHENTPVLRIDFDQDSRRTP